MKAVDESCKIASLRRTSYVRTAHRIARQMRIIKHLSCESAVIVLLRGKGLNAKPPTGQITSPAVASEILVREGHSGQHRLFRFSFTNAAFFTGANESIRMNGATVCGDMIEKPTRVRRTWS